jgi:signal transduction histidine kinase
MRRGYLPVKRGGFFLSLAAGTALCVLSIFGFALLRLRPGLPAGVERSEVVRVDETPIERLDELPFVLSGKSVGDPLTVVTAGPGGRASRTVTLIPYYSRARLPYVYLVIGLINFAVGFIVILLKPRLPLARIFFWAAASFAFAIVVSGEFYCRTRSPSSWLPGFAYNMLYTLAPALLIHFCLALSGRMSRRLGLLIYGPAGALAALLEASYLAAILRGSLPSFRFHLGVVYAFRWYLVAAIVLSLAILLRNLGRSRSREEKARIEWIFFGLAVGLAPFVLLYQLPRLLGIAPPLSEDLSSVFYIVIPVAFAIAIVQYKLMRIELVLNRSLVYGFLSVFLAVLYLTVLEGVRAVSAGFFVERRTLLSLAVALVLAAVFQPARRRIQNLVDRLFFRQSYDARRALLRFSDQAQRTPDLEGLGDAFENHLAGALPAKSFHLGLFDAAGGPGRPNLTRGSIPVLEALRPIASRGPRVLSREAAVAVGEGLDLSADGLLASLRLDVAAFLPFSRPSWTGVVALGPKRSGERYRAEDLDFLTSLSAELALHVERVKLQEEVIYERASREKLDELNRLKTEFVSSVSHELRTPLTSLRGLVEVLQSGKLKDEAGRERVLDILAAESGRLSRLLHNILDYGTIEQQAKVYDLRPTVLQSVVRDTLRLLRLGGAGAEFVLREDLPARPLTLPLDRDAVEQALINLVDNAMKYAGDRKEIEVGVVEDGRHVLVRVRDWGIGVAAADRERIFEAFYRAADAGRHNPKGVGLGLKIVRHIMEGHGGSVRVEPAPGRGTVFSLVFPKP